MSGKTCQPTARGRRSHQWDACPFCSLLLCPVPALSPATSSRKAGIPPSPAHQPPSLSSKSQPSFLHRNQLHHQHPHRDPPPCLAPALLPRTTHSSLALTLFPATWGLFQDLLKQDSGRKSKRSRNLPRSLCAHFPTHPYSHIESLLALPSFYAHTCTGKHSTYVTQGGRRRKEATCNLLVSHTLSEAIRKELSIAYT